MAKKIVKGSDGLIDTMNEGFDKAPSLPKNAKAALVKYTPWIVLVFGILGIFGAISGLGLLTTASPFAAMAGASGMSSIGSGFMAALIWLLASVLMLAAFPGLKAQKMNGWNLLFWSEVVHLIGSVVALSFVSAIIGALIAFYLLFQIRPYYK